MGRHQTTSATVRTPDIVMNQAIQFCLFFLLTGNCSTSVPEIPEDNQDDSEPSNRCKDPLTDYLQDDPQLISIIKECYLKPSSGLPYNFTQKEPFIRGQVDQPILVDHIYNKTSFDGFFIEAGAWDGEALSNSLLFELLRGWTGLLVEPDRAGYKTLEGKHRKAWSSPTCLSTQKQPMIAKFNENHLLGGIQNGDIKPGMGRESFRENTVDVLCLPVYSLLLALDNPTVHYFSLDIEGAEMLVLKTIPWDKVDIWLLGVETNHGGEVFPWKRMDVLDYMEEVGYEWVGTAGIDDLFVRPDKLYVVDTLKMYIRQSRKPQFYNDQDKLGLRYGRKSPMEISKQQARIARGHSEL